MSPAKKILYDPNKPIVYFCAEYAVEGNLPIYAGGLGILAADLIWQARDDQIPWVAIGLFYQRGFGNGHVRRSLIDPKLAGFQLLTDNHGRPVQIPIDVYDRCVYARVWHHSYGTAHLYLLDTNSELNSLEDRLIAEYLYDERFERRLLQEVVLGVGGIKLLTELGITPRIYHLNEGHTSFAILALALDYLHEHPDAKTFGEAVAAVRTRIVGTKHTILPGAGLYFTKEQFRRVISCYFKKNKASFDEFFEIGRMPEDPVTFSTTKFMLEGSNRSSAVSTLHAFFEKEKHPHSPLIPITNGIYQERWRSTLWHGTEPTDEELWRVHNALKQELITYVFEKTRVRLRPDVLTIVWARRFAGYKRPHLLFSNLKRLSELANQPQTPVQFIIAGQAHPGDLEGNELIERILAYAKTPEFKDKIVYLPDYSLSLARILTQGADVWLNTPERGKEACGTSGMKSGLNGVLQFSISDGWVGEVDWIDKGWVLPELDIEEHLYNIIERDIVPAFYTRSEDGLPRSWVSRMRSTMETVETRYSLSRTIKDYFEKLYPESL